MKKFPYPRKVTRASVSPTREELARRAKELGNRDRERGAPVAYLYPVKLRGRGEIASCSGNDCTKAYLDGRFPSSQNALYSMVSRLRTGDRYPGTDVRVVFIDPETGAPICAS